MDITEFLKREISQNYQVNNRQAAGGCSIVYDATRLSDQMRVAIKVLSLPETLEPDEAELTKLRFCREALLMITLHNPHIAECLDYGVFNGAPCIVLEFVDGKPLDIYIKEFGVLPFELSVNLTCQLLDALETSHSMGVIHRDIKPGNILLTGDDANPSVRLIDYGIASMTEGPETDRLSTKMGSIRGTPSYMAPELFSGFASASPVSDLYAAGLVLYECLTGSVAYTGVTVMEIAFKQTHQELTIPSFIPKCLAQVILKSCSKLPDLRYQTAHEMSEALKAVLPEAEAQRDSCARTYMDGANDNNEKDDAQSEKKSNKKPIMIGLAALALIGLTAAVTIFIMNPAPQADGAPVQMMNLQGNLPVPDASCNAIPTYDHEVIQMAPDSANDSVLQLANVAPPDSANDVIAEPESIADVPSPDPDPQLPPEPVAAAPDTPPTPTTTAPAPHSPKTNKIRNARKKTSPTEDNAEKTNTQDKKTKKNNMVIPSNLI